MSSPSIRAARPVEVSDSFASRAARLSLIVFLHIGFFFMLQSGLARNPEAAATPNTVFVSFVTPEPPAIPDPPQPLAPPVPPVPKPVKPAPRSKPVEKAVKRAPPVNETPSEKAIAAPPAAPPEPAPPAAAPPPVATAPAASAPQQQAPRPPDQPRVVTSGIEYLQPPAPDYPPAARRMGEEGKVVLRVLVNERGRPEGAEIQVSSGSSRLDEAARRAVLRAVFKAHIENGRPVAVYAIIPIRFQLDS